MRLVDGGVGAKPHGRGNGLRADSVPAPRAVVDKSCSNIREKQMQKILFYCQNLLGMGHLVRTTELIRALVREFKVCLIDGGQLVEGFELPPEVEVVHLPALQVEVSDALQVGKQLKVVGSSMSLEEVKQFRIQTILDTFDQFQPDCVITEGYPFSKNKILSFEMVPFLLRVRQAGRPIQVICSLRDIIMVKEFDDRDAEEQRRCEFVNQFYDALLVHSDPKIHRLEDNISQVHELTCPIYYTGYVVQSEPEHLQMSPEDVASLSDPKPMIVVSVGGGKLGHDLLECMIESAPILSQYLPHQIYMFAGPLMADEKYRDLQQRVSNKDNITLRQYTPHLLAYLQKADLSISLGGYNTTMNILKTGVRAMIYPSNKDQEQSIRAEKLASLRLLEILHPQELQPNLLAEKILAYLQKLIDKSIAQTLELHGAQKTVEILKQVVEFQKPVANANVPNRRLE
jgi:predicted glycosyltransferase